MPLYVGDTEVNKVYLGANPFDNIQNGASELWTNAVLPTVSSDSTANVGTTTIRVYGTVSSDGGASVTERGFYFGTSSNYASNTKYSVGSGTGGFNSYRTGLSSNTTYYYTAYAINSVGETRGTTKSQATNFNYTFKSGTILSVYGSTGTVYYQNISGGWVARSGVASSTWSCASFSTNRTNRLIGSDPFFQVMKGTNNQTQAGCAGNSMGFGNFSVSGGNFSNSSSYWQIYGSGTDVTFTAS